MHLNEFTYFYPEAPKLLHVGSDLFHRLSQDPAWIAEKKYNENRLELHCRARHYMRRVPRHGYFEFWNRHHELLNYEPSEEMAEALVLLFENLKGYCLFDGGLRHNKVKGVRHKIVIYDIFVWNSELLLREQFDERRKRIADLFPNDESIIRIPEHYPGSFDQTYCRVIEDDEIEGLVMKRLTGKIKPGRSAPIDSNWMFKVRKPSGRYKF